MIVDCRPEQAQRSSGIGVFPAIHCRNGAALVPAYEKSRPRNMPATLGEIMSDNSIPGALPEASG